MSRLVPEARQAHKLWSVRLSILAAVLGGMDAALRHWDGIIPDAPYALLATLCAIGVPIVRVIRQTRLTNAEQTVGMGGSSSDDGASSDAETSKPEEER